MIRRRNIRRKGKDDSKKEAGEKKPADTVEPKKANAVEPKKADGGPITVILKLDLHCEGCAKKVKKSVRHFEGVESVKADTDGDKLTVTGKVDPTRIKERVEYKTRKKVEIISPQPKKDGGGGEKKADDKPAEKKADDEKADEKKPKETQSTTVVLKIHLHCDGCIHKIKRIISKIDGVESVMPEASEDLVTVKGTMNVKEMIPHLKEKLKRSVDIVPPKKEENNGGDKKDDKVGGKKEEEKEEKGGGGSKKEEGGGDKKDKEGGGSVGGDGDGTRSLDVVNKFEHFGLNPHTDTMMPSMYSYNQYYHNQDYGAATSSSRGYPTEYSHMPPPSPPPPMFLHDPQAPEAGMLSDENPNACSVM